LSVGATLTDDFLAAMDFPHVLSEQTSKPISRALASHTSNCCSQSTLLTFFSRKRSYEDYTTDLCSHENEPEYEPEYEPCSTDADGCPSTTQRGNNNDEAGLSGVRPCDSSKEAKRVYPRLPSVELGKTGCHLRGGHRGVQKMEWKEACTSLY